MIRRLYKWVLHWAETPYGVPALFVIAFVESSFFPIPPDVLLIALAFSIPKKSFRYATVCTVGSVLGGMLGWLIGLQFYDTIGVQIIRTLHYEEEFALVKSYYAKNAFLYILLAAFTPIPYKVFTIGAGVCHISFSILIAASILGRGGRFFLVGAAIHFFGPRIKPFLEKYLDWATAILAGVALLGFLAIRFLK
ncbi:MAG: DedA family protein [Candidatus Omnitrophica bacterium]|nr:DedA family protein [Candidatus Omnitrophota bacterium]